MPLIYAYIHDKFVFFVTEEDQEEEYRFLGVRIQNSIQLLVRNRGNLYYIKVYNTVTAMPTNGSRFSPKEFLSRAEVGANIY